MGGTCLNVGCIPTKTLLANAELKHKLDRAADYGIDVGSVTVHYDKMKARKDNVVAKLRKGVEGLLTANRIAYFHGHAEFISPTELKVQGKESVLITAQNTIIATGSEPLDIPSFPCDHKRVFHSSSILERTTLPKSIAIIGGGYIGCEFASLFSALGVSVTILEALPSIVIAQGQSVSDALSLAFKKRGVIVETGVTVEDVVSKENGVEVRVKGRESLHVDIVLVAVGRKVVSEGMQLEKAGVIRDAKGAIVVNDKMETNVPGIYAIGDVTGKVLLAHVASHQGIVAAMNASGGNASMQYNAVPAVIFTSPEIATVGFTLEQAKEQGWDAKIGKFPFQALGKSIATMETEGFAQIVVDRKTDQILGAQVVGHDASTLIAEITLAIHNELTLESIIDTIHAHPTVAESWLEAALIANDTPIHFPPKR